MLRVLKIVRVALRYGLDEIALSGPKVSPRVRLLSSLFFWRKIDAPRGERLRRALEELGPIFVKFGQVLSTRRDLLPADIADQLALLQDRVPPFSSELAIAEITRALGAHPDQLFGAFQREPVASASVAQVHFARLHAGKVTVEAGPIFIYDDAGSRELPVGEVPELTKLLASA